MQVKGNKQCVANSDSCFYLKCGQVLWVMLVFSASGINPCVQTHGQTGMAAWSMECPHSSNTLATNPRSTSSAGWLHKYSILKCHISINKSVLFLWNQKRWRQLSFFFFFSYRTKIFIRFPKTLFATEDALEVRKHSLGMSHIQKHTVSCVTVHWMVCRAPPDANFHNLFFMHSYQTAGILERLQSKNQIS